MSGHVFVLHSDIRKLACDAWLMPCDGKFTPKEKWFLKDQERRSGEQGGPHVQLLPSQDPGCPQIWMTDVGGSDDTPISWYVNRVNEFLHASFNKLSEERILPLNNRQKHLIALSIVGVRRGGASERIGEMVRGLLPALYDFVDSHNVDIALVSFNQFQHAAAQAIRLQLASDRLAAELSIEQQQAAEELANLARKGQLALFLGAGVSMAAGLPGWKSLLRQLAERGSNSEKEIQALTELHSTLDQATIVERWLEAKEEKLNQAVANIVNSKTHHAPGHVLLATLPVREVITTNYDCLFDKAWKHCQPQETISILPDKLIGDAARWLFKMHGTAERPETIVLTRASYTRYDERLPALAGIVQSLLLTRHVLFVGFSLTDDNFHRIIDGVRRIQKQASRTGKLGTTISLAAAGISGVLWERDLDRIEMSEQLDSEEGFSHAANARKLEIFLDYLVSQVRTSHHLLNGAQYTAALDPGEIILRDALEDLIQKLAPTDGHAEIRDDVQTTAAWPEVERMLQALGKKTK